VEGEGIRLTPFHSSVGADLRVRPGQTHGSAPTEAVGVWATGLITETPPFWGRLSSLPVPKFNHGRLESLPHTLSRPTDSTIPSSWPDRWWAFRN
jgi:hypothetical protein